MTIERIRTLCDQHPFQPFTIRMSDGRQIAVPHRDFIALGPGGRTLIVYEPDESFHIVDLLLVTDLHVAATSAGNGHGT